MKSGFLSAAVVLLLICGCSHKTNSDASLQQKIDALDQRVGALEWDGMVGEWSRTNKFVSLSLDEKGYTPVQVTIGQLLVSAKSATPYLDGYKVNFQIGNPQSVTYNGATVTLKWGPSATPSVYSNQVARAAWQNAQKTKTEDLLSELLPGYWNDEEIIVTPATTEELRNLQISIETSTLSLKNANNTP
jgi:hypothetical protein